MEDPALPTPNGIVRALILLILKARWHRPFRSLWRKQTGLFHIFGVCIKVRPDEDLNEAHALQFVSSHTDIPVPKLYYAFTRKGASYIVMEHIEGDMAARGWLSRSEESKTRILGQLRSMINQLRSVKTPAKVGVSNLSGGAFYDCRLPHSLHWGPFTCVREFHQALVRPLGLDDELSFTPEQSDLAELLRFYREAEEKIVLTHGDLSSLNIVVRGDEVAAIVDWETCGWFPSYWEYTCAKYANPLNPFWADEVDRFLDAMPRENEMDTTRRKYFGDF